MKVKEWYDSLDHPDAHGSSEYRAVYDILFDIIIEDEEDIDTKASLEQIISSLDQFIEVAQMLKTSAINNIKEM